MEVSKRPVSVCVSLDVATDQYWSLQATAKDCDMSVASLEQGALCLQFQELSVEFMDFDGSDYEEHCCLVGYDAV
jgi:hypothetical protein